MDKHTKAALDSAKGMRVTVRDMPRGMVGQTRMLERLARLADNLGYSLACAGQVTPTR